MTGARAQPSSGQQQPLPTRPIGVSARPARTPRAWTPTDRWAWAFGLPVSGIARAVAGCIAYHANDKTGKCWPGIATIVSETGFKRTAVIAAIKELEGGGHLRVIRSKTGKKNDSNRYQLPYMENVSASYPSALDGLPSALDGLPPTP